jgi:hypothetical protein
MVTLSTGSNTSGLAHHLAVEIDSTPKSTTKKDYNFETIQVTEEMCIEH